MGDIKICKICKIQLKDNYLQDANSYWCNTNPDCMTEEQKLTGYKNKHRQWLDFLDSFGIKKKTSFHNLTINQDSAKRIAWVSDMCIQTYPPWRICFVEMKDGTHVYIDVHQKEFDKLVDKNTIRGNAYLKLDPNEPIDPVENLFNQMLCL